MNTPSLFVQRAGGRRAFIQGRGAVFCRALFLALLFGLLAGTRLHAQIFVENGTASTVMEYDGTGYLVNYNFANYTNGLYMPSYIITSGTDVYVANGDDAVVGYTFAGARLEYDPVSGTAGLSGFDYIAAGGGNIYAVDYEYNVIQKIPSGGVTSTTLYTLPDTDNFTAMTLSGTSTIYVTDATTGNVGSYTTNGGTSNTSLITGLTAPTGISVSGTLIFVTSGNTIGEYNTSGSAINSALITDGSTPVYIQAAGSSLYVENANDTISKYNTSGMLVTSVLVYTTSADGFALGNSNPAVTWLGNTGGLWTGYNWEDSSGTSTSATPTAADDVTFSASGAAHENTTLGTNFSIHSLTVNADASAVTISGSTLSITASASGLIKQDITTDAGADLLTINSNLVLASGSITSNNTAGIDLTGTVSGAAGLGISGTSFVELTNSANNFTSTIIVELGATLEVTNDGAMGNTNNTVTLDGGSTLFLNGSITTARSISVTDATIERASATTSTISSAISGGDLTLTGSGTLILTAANTYNSETFITSGMLQLGNGTSGKDGTISNSSGIADSGTLFYDRFGSSTYSGSTSGTGQVFVGGVGTEILSGSSSYTGTTTLSGTATLQAGSIHGFSPGSAYTMSADNTLDLGGFSNTIGSLANSGTVTDTGAAATLTTGSVGSSTFNGTIQNGTGVLSLRKIGGGTFGLSGANTYSGSTVVSGGTLTVNGSIDNSPAFVSGGAVLNGSGSTGDVTVNSGGTLNGTLTSGVVAVNAGGTVQAGDAPGSNTMTSLTLTGSATYQEEIVVPGGGSYTGPGDHPIAGTDYGQTTLTGSGDGQTAVSLDSANSILRLNVTGALPASGVASNANPYIAGGANTSLDNYFILHLSNSTDTTMGRFAEVTLDGTNFTPIDYSTGNLLGGINGEGTFTLDGLEWAISYTGNAVDNSDIGGNDVVITAIPEPGSYVLLALGGVGMVAISKRRKSFKTGAGSPESFRGYRSNAARRSNATRRSVR